MFAKSSGHTTLSNQAYFNKTEIEYITTIYTKRRYKTSSFYTILYEYYAHKQLEMLTNKSNMLIPLTFSYSQPSLTLCNRV